MPNSGKRHKRSKSNHQQSINFFVWVGIILAVIMVALIMWFLGKSRQF